MLVFLCRHAEYRSQYRTHSSDVSQKTVVSYLSTNTSDGTDKYGVHHPQQKAITMAIIDDLIVQCNLPLSIVEHPNFRHFMSVVDSKYVPVTRSTATAAVVKKSEVMQSTIVDMLTSVKSVNLTVDIWSDRKMRAYLGVTCHFVTVDEHACPKLQSLLLNCHRFSGSHTGERIASEFESILDAYEIKQKVDHVITDNAANMKKAMTLTLSCEYDDDDDNVASSISTAVEGVAVDASGVHAVSVDEPELWQELAHDDEAEVANVINTHSRQERLSCFDHTLHLVVGDGLKSTRCVSAALAKCCKTSSLLHTSSSFKDAFEQQFGGNKSIPAAVVTRWNSSLRQIKAVLSVDFKQLCDLLESQEHKNLVPSAREWGQLAELVDILDPFMEATAFTEGEYMITLSYALPSVLSLVDYLEDIKPRLKYCTPICTALIQSLKSRFTGLLQHFVIDTTADITSLPFGSDIYIIATFFDPKFKLRWIDNNAATSDSTKLDLRKHVTGN